MASPCRYEYQPTLKKLDMDMKNCETQPERQSVEEEPKFELKALPPIFKEFILGYDETLLVITTKILSGDKLSVW